MPSSRYFSLNDDKKKRLDDAVFDEMMRHTYEHLNLSNIIRDANISRGSLYQYFMDKKDLYLHYIVEISKQKKLFLSQKTFSEKTNSLNYIQELLFYSLEFSKMFPKLALIGIRLYESKDPIILRLLESSNQESTQYYTSILKSDSNYQKLTNLESIAQFITDVTQGFSISWSKDLNYQTFHNHIHMLIQLLKGGITHV